MDTPLLTRSDFQLASGARLRRLIGLLGITQVEAGRIMGVSKNNVRNYLAGAHPIPTYAVYRLCRAKGVDFNYLFLEDWSRLPHNLARTMEDELVARLGEIGALAPQADERTEVD